jgi:FkbM family methyltransferase
LFGTEIPLEIAAEAIEKSDLVLAISPEMKQAYEQRFGKKIWLLPPVVPNELIAKQLVPPVTAIEIKPPSNWRSRIQSLAFNRKIGCGKHISDSNRGILIGNIWNRDWLGNLRVAIRESGLKIDWYTNNPDAVWLEDSIENLESDGIYLHEPLWGDDLVTELRRRPFAIMPTSELNGCDEKESIARLSLPSRVPFIVATSQTPIIAMGSAQTAAAKFIERFGVGTVVGYNGTELRDAVGSINRLDQQIAIRRRAFNVAESFGSNSVGQWLWESLERGQPSDQRFETLFPAKPGEFSCFFNPEPPKHIHWSFRETWQMLSRIKHQGFTPDTIIDVGASTGVWSWTASTLFPNAKYVLVDPMMSHYSEQERRFYSRSLPSVELVEAALSDHCGETEILVSNDLYGTSLLKIDEKSRTVKTSTVKLLTLDEMARQKRLSGRTLLKVDVQFAEHLVISGGLDFIRNNVDAIILELTIEREHPQAKTYREMLDLMDSIGFAVVDEMEGWRDPITGRLEQKDSVFVRHEAIAHRHAA